jgi:hypothetical protein
MTNATLSLNTDSIQYQVRKTTGELYAGAENLRLIAAALWGQGGRTAGHGRPGAAAAGGCHRELARFSEPR